MGCYLLCCVTYSNTPLWLERKEPVGNFALQVFLLHLFRESVAEDSGKRSEGEGCNAVCFLMQGKALTYFIQETKIT